MSPADLTKFWTRMTVDPDATKAEALTAARDLARLGHGMGGPDVAIQVNQAAILPDSVDTAAMIALAEELKAGAAPAPPAPAAECSTSDDV